MTAYSFWTACLAAKAAGKPLPIATNEQAECGFWRLKRNGGWLPVAVWPKKNGLQGADALGFKIGDKTVGSNMGVELWPSFCANPVTEDTYRDVAEKGGGWPDADPTVTAIIAQGKPIAIRSPGIPNPEADAELEQAFIADGDRRKVDPTTEFREQIDTALGGVPGYAKIESDEADVRALSLRNMLNDLAAESDKAREAEKKPHWDAAKAVDLKWQPLVKSARDGAGQIKAARDRWADAKMEAAKLATDRARDAEQEAMVAGKPPAPTQPSNLPPPTAQVRPTYGKASSTGTKMVVTAIDYDKFFAALKLRPAQWPTVKEQFDEWAQKLANKGIIPDGVTAEERSNTR